MGYLAHIAVMIEISLLTALGYHLSFGLARLMNLSHGALVAIGAYAAAITSLEFGVPIIFSLAIAASCAGIASLLLSGVAAKFPGDSFTLATLAIAGIVHSLSINWRSLTRGVLGIPGIPAMPVLQLDPAGTWNLALTLLMILVPSFLCVLWVDRGRWGRLLRAYGESPNVADSIGISGVWVRAVSLGGGAILAGLAGGIYASYISYIDPSIAHISEMVAVLAIIVLGRPGSLGGAVAATVGLLLLPEALRFVSLPSSMLGHLRMLMYAIVLYGALYARRHELLRMSRVV